MTRPLTGGRGGGKECKVRAQKPPLLFAVAPAHIKERFNPLHYRPGCSDHLYGALILPVFPGWQFVPSFNPEGTGQVEGTWGINLKDHHSGQARRFRASREG